VWARACTHRPAQWRSTCRVRSHLFDITPCSSGSLRHTICVATPQHVVSVSKASVLATPRGALRRRCRAAAQHRVAAARAHRLARRGPAAVAVSASRAALAGGRVVLKRRRHDVQRGSDARSRSTRALWTVPPQASRQASSRPYALRRERRPRLKPPPVRPGRAFANAAVARAQQRHVHQRAGSAGRGAAGGELCAVAGALHGACAVLLRRLPHRRHLAQPGTNHGPGRRALRRQLRRRGPGAVPRSFCALEV